MTKPIMSAKLETKRFGKFLKRYMEKQLPENAEAAIIGIATLLLRKVILKNPVDTGRSRAGWSAAGKLLGFSDVSRFPGSKDAGKVPADLTTAEKGTAKIDKAGNYSVSVKLVNGVEYSVNLERGTSTQAPLVDPHEVREGAGVDLPARPPPVRGLDLDRERRGALEGVDEVFLDRPADVGGVGAGMDGH